MNMLRRASNFGSKISHSRRRSNASQASEKRGESRDRKIYGTSPASDLSKSSSNPKRSDTSTPDREPSTTIDESDLTLQILRMDIAMHSYFCFHANPDYQYPGTWVCKTLQQLFTHVPILYPKDPQAYQDWVVGSAIAFIEQHNTNIKRLTDIARHVRAGTLDSTTHPGTVPVSRSSNSDVAKLTELVRSLEPRLGRPKNRAQLFELTIICISSLKQQLVAIDEDWDFHKQPWEGDLLGSIEDTWDYIHSSHGRTPFNNKELARAVELVYHDHVHIEPDPPLYEEIQSEPTSSPTNKDKPSTHHHKGHRHRSHSRTASTEPDSTSSHSRHRRQSRSRTASTEPDSHSSHSHHRRRSRSHASRALQKEKEQEEYIEHLKRRHARKEQEEALHSQTPGQEQAYHDYRRQRRLRREESEQDYLEHLQRVRARQERKEHEEGATGGAR